MPDPGPIWLQTMRSLDGTHWAQGDGPNEKIQSWLRFIGATYPDMAGYCNSVMNEDYFSWCGLAAGYCMAKAGIRPVFGDSGDTSRFLYAAAWLGWGNPVTTPPQPGDVVVFDFGSGDHHVTFFEKDNGDGTWSCHGGNQSHEVNATNFRKSRVMGVRRAIAAGAVQVVTADTLAPGAVGRAVTALQSALAAKGFDPGGIDGEYGPLTSAAVSDFQRAQNLSVTGIADPATLRSLGLSIDGGGPLPDGPTEEPTMQLQDLFKTLLDALIAKQVGPTVPVQTPTTQAPVDINQLLQIAIAALVGRPLPALPQLPASTTATTVGPVASTTTPPVLSTIDQLLGGQALAGKKTMLAVVAYVILAILQAAGVTGTASGPHATPTGEILTTLITSFGLLGGVAKVDRLTQVLGLLAGQSGPKK